MPDIESLLKEKRSFKPSPEFAKQANWSRKQVAEYRKLGEKSAVDQSARLATAFREVVRRRQDQHRVQLPRSPPHDVAQEQGRDHLGRRAG
jgi:hypothetical protein